MVKELFRIKLHWLPIKARIEFKICLIVFKALRFGQPKYIADMLSPPVTISHLRVVHTLEFAATEKYLS